MTALTTPPPPPRQVAEAAAASTATPKPTQAPALAHKAEKPTRRFSLHGNLGFLSTVFYGWALVMAAVGSSTAAVNWLGWSIHFAVPAVLGVEIGGVYLLALADERRRLGEQAIVERLLSALVAIGAVALNWFGHQDNVMQAAYFAGMSALAYVIWLIRSEHRRRDELRAAGRMRDTGPAYGLMRWLLHPIETAQARAAAIEHGLGLFDSIEWVRRRKRMNAFVQWRVKRSANRAVAEAIVQVYDPNRFAAELAAKVDWDAYTTWMAQELDPRRVLGPGDQSSGPAPAVPVAPLPQRAHSSPTAGAAPRAVAASTSPAVVRTVTAPIDARAESDLDDGDNDDARGRDRGRGSRRRAREARRLDGWWTTAREKAYRNYANHLDATGQELSASELMPELGKSDGGARNMRNSKFRERYVREVAEGAREPRAQLPPHLAEAIARYAATTASLTREMPVLERAVRESESA